MLFAKSTIGTVSVVTVTVLEFPAFTPPVTTNLKSYSLAALRPVTVAVVALASMSPVVAVVHSFSPAGDFSIIVLVASLAAVAVQVKVAEVDVFVLIAKSVIGIVYVVALTVLEFPALVPPVTNSLKSYPLAAPSSVTVAVVALLAMTPVAAVVHVSDPDSNC